VGGAVTWWWDNYIEPKNLWHHYAALAKFAAGIDWPRRAFEPLSLQSPTLADATPTRLKPMALAAGKDEFLVWLWDPESNCTNDLAKKPPAKLEGLLLTLPVTGNATYRIEWWDTRQAKIIKRDTASPHGGLMKLTIPSFERDIALRVVK
jgi:hypothetical protein